jgi:O-antigen/teichoic acid export membrane protein
MVTVVTIAISPIQISVYPKMIEWYNSNIDIYYKKYQAITSLTTWIYIVGTAFAFIVAPVLLDKFLGVAYSKSLDVFKVQVFGALFMYNAALRSSHFTLTGNTNIMMVSQIIAVFVNIVLNYLMIPKIGIYGAAAATVVTQFFSLFLSNLFFKNGRKIFWLQLKGLNPMYIVQGLGLKESHRP